MDSSMMDKYRYKGSLLTGFESIGGSVSTDLNVEKASSHSGVHSKSIPFFISLKNGKAFLADTPRKRDNVISLNFFQIGWAWSLKIFVTNRWYVAPPFLRPKGIAMWQ
ncbi:hypothetical protein PIB30_034870 [Stylosanthes scabra]|uniref:Uncharacterized protein n=1 Tax=Stylosanthes scabra TaxID=79078 RepID=A0ABU6QD02_9FABA|nr:hypothetical protein [Stylosanthes scabra]